MSSRRPSNDSLRPVRHEGRAYPVIGRQRIAGRTYLLIKQLASAPRVRFQAFDPRVRQFRCLLKLPATAVSRRHLESIQRASAANDSIPTLVEFAKQGDDFWVVLTWVNGSDLKQYLNKVRAGTLPRPSSREVVRLLRGLVHGLRHLHNTCQLVHGDLKPANLILQSRPTRLVTIDFGSAWLREHAADCRTGDGFSRVYTAPELQFDIELQPDFRADQFSASVIAYELLTLQLPYANLGGAAARPESLNQIDIPLKQVSELSPDAKQLPLSLIHI